MLPTLIHPLQLDGHTTVELHATLPWLVYAATVLCNRRPDHANSERFAGLKRRVQVLKVAAVAEVDEGASERRVVERVVVAERAAHPGEGHAPQGCVRCWKKFGEERAATRREKAGRSAGVSPHACKTRRTVTVHSGFFDLFNVMNRIEI